MARIDVLGGFGLAVQGSKFHFTLTIVSLTLAKCKTGKKTKQKLWEDKMSVASACKTIPILGVV